MEVLGAVSGSLAIVDGAAVSIRKTVKTLKRLREAPQGLTKLLDKVAVITFVTDAVSDAASAIGAPAALEGPLDQLNRQLLELQQLIHFKLVRPGQALEVDRIAWARYSKTACRQLDEISKTADGISLFFSTRMFVEMMQMRQQLQEFSSTNTNSQAHSFVQGESTDFLSEGHMLRIDGQNHVVACNSDGNTLRGQPQLPEPPLGAIEDVTRLHQDVVQRTTLPVADLAPLYPAVKTNNEKSSIAVCPRTCRCRCHKSKKWALPLSLRYLLGSSQITIANLSIISGVCTQRNCQKRMSTRVYFNYAFPPRMAATMISAWYSRSTGGSIERVIRLAQSVHTSAYYYAQYGDLSSLRNLYIKGEASIHDVDPVDGSTALSTAVCSDHFAIVRFLLAGGADPAQQDFVGYDARTHALENYFDPGMHNSIEEICAIFELNDLIDEEELTSLHRILLGRSCQDFATELENHPELLDVPDAHGRTPLYWAAWREDLAAVEILVRQGANVHAASGDGCNILHVIASLPCAQEVYQGITASLSHVCSLPKDLTSCLKTQNAYGEPPWHIALGRDRVDLLRSWLEYNLDLSVKTNHQRTMFHIAARDASASMLSFLTTVNLNGVDLMAVNIYGCTAMDEIVERMNDDVNEPYAYALDAETAEALVRFVTYARTFEPRLPRLIYGYRLAADDNEPEYGLFDPNSGTEVNDQWFRWVGIEDWLEQRGHLDLSEAFGSMSEDGDQSEDDTYFDATG